MEVRLWGRHPDESLAVLALGTSVFFWLVFAGLGALYVASLGPAPDPPLHDRAVLPARGDYEVCPEPRPSPTNSTTVLYCGNRCALDSAAYSTAVQAERTKIERRNRARDEAYAQAVQQRWTHILSVALGVVALLIGPLGCLLWVRRTRPRLVVLDARRLRIGSEHYLLEDEAQTGRALARLDELDLDKDLTEPIQRAHASLSEAVLPPAPDRRALQHLRTG